MKVNDLVKPFAVRRSVAEKMFGSATLFKALKKAGHIKPVIAPKRTKGGTRGNGSPELYDYQDLENVWKQIREGWITIE